MSMKVKSRFAERRPDFFLKAIGAAVKSITDQDVRTAVDCFERGRHCGQPRAKAQTRVPLSEIV